MAPITQLAAPHLSFIFFSFLFPSALFDWSVSNGFWCDRPMYQPFTTPLPTAKYSNKHGAPQWLSVSQQQHQHSLSWALAIERGVRLEHMRKRVTASSKERKSTGLHCTECGENPAGRRRTQLVTCILTLDIQIQYHVIDRNRSFGVTHTITFVDI